MRPALARAARGLALLVVGLVVGLVVQVGLAAAQPSATVRGTVVDRATRAPVAGVVITLGAEVAISEADGGFAITIAPGRYQLATIADWLVATRRPLIVAGDVAIVIETDPAAEGVGETIAVVDVAPTQPGETRVDAALAGALPGGGDAGKVVQSLPAVARPPAGSAELVVWGAAPRDTRVFVDGVPVPALYHLGGYRAAIGDDLVAGVRLTAAAFGVERGRAIGGVVDLALADPASLPRWRVALDPLDARLAGKVARGGVTVAAAVRRSWLERAVGLIAAPAELAPTVPLPRWTDGQIAARAHLGADLTLTAWALGALGVVDRTLASDDPATSVSHRVESGWVRAQATLAHDRADGSDRLTVWFGRDRGRDDLEVGLTSARVHVEQWVGGARASQHTRLDDAATLTLGVDLDGERALITRSGSLTIPAREGDARIFGQPPGDDVAFDRWSATTVDLAGHAAIDLRRDRITATVGARVDGWMLAASRLTPRIGTTPAIASQQLDVTVDPRASLQVALSTAGTVRFDAGRYHQARAAVDTSAVFGTPALGREQAWHATIGGQWRRPPFVLELATYARHLDHLVARDPAVTPLVASALTQGGTGRVLGAQVTARAVGWRGLSGWLSYGWSRSTRRDGPGLAERPFDRDQTHGLVAAGAWSGGPWTVGARVRAATGEPRTDVVGAFFDSRSGRYQPVRGPLNGVRLPAFFAADLRGERRIPLSGARLALYLELQNLTARANSEELVYSADFATRGTLDGLPFLALIGLQVEP